MKEVIYRKNGMNLFFNNHEYFFVTEKNIKSKSIVEFVTKALFKELNITCEPKQIDYDFIKDRLYIATLEHYLMNGNKRYTINIFYSKERKYSSACTAGIFDEDITIIEVTL